MSWVCSRPAMEVLLSFFPFSQYGLIFSSSGVAPHVLGRFQLFFLKPTALNFPSYSCLPRKSPPRGFAIASNDSLLTRRGWCGSCYRAKRRQKASGDYLGQNSGFCIPRHSPLQSSAAPTGLTTLKYVRGPWFSFHYVAI